MFNTKRSIYDELCRVLTDYEGNGSEEGASADDLYSMLVKIQNNWECVITAEDDGLNKVFNPAPRHRFNRKGYGRIYTDTEGNIEKIREIIRDMNADEYDYLPVDLIAVYSGSYEPVYNGKFYDFDLDALVERCQREGIPCRVVVGEELLYCPNCGR